jgi:hypothetical protein
VQGGQRFEDFYGAVYGRLVGQLYLVTGDIHDAEDVVERGPRSRVPVTPVVISSHTRG